LLAYCGWNARPRRPRSSLVAWPAAHDRVDVHERRREQRAVLDDLDDAGVLDDEQAVRVAGRRRQVERLREAALDERAPQGLPPGDPGEPARDDGGQGEGGQERTTRGGVDAHRRILLGGV
jgi:hypothetical protein